MFPIRDTNPRSNTPWVVRTLIILNGLAFMYELSLGELIEPFIGYYGVVPARFLQDGGAWFTALTSVFLHGGWMHLLGNMWFLHIFGDNVEDRLGHTRFIIFYLLCGVIAALVQSLATPQSLVPMIGASGAIAGVLGGYIVLFPHAKVLSAIPVFIFIQFVELRAFWFLIIWFAYQGFMSYMAFGASTEGGVAFLAHVGGFVAGVVLVKLLMPRRAAVRR